MPLERIEDIRQPKPSHAQPKTEILPRLIIGSICLCSVLIVLLYR